jgi:hypothetical protein
VDLDGLITAALSPRAMHARVVQYLVEQAGSGRRLADALDDPFVVNRTNPGERRGLLEDARLVGAWHRSTLSAMQDAAPGGDAERRLLRSAHAAPRRRMAALRRACAALDERRGREAVVLLGDALPPLRADLQARLTAERAVLDPALERCGLDEVARVLDLQARTLVGRLEVLDTLLALLGGRRPDRRQREELRELVYGLDGVLSLHLETVESASATRLGRRLEPREARALAVALANGDRAPAARAAAS